VNSGFAGAGGEDCCAGAEATIHVIADKQRARRRLDERTSIPPDSQVEINVCSNETRRSISIRGGGAKLECPCKTRRFELRNDQKRRPIEKLILLCPVGLTLAASARGPTMVSAITPRLNVPRTATGPGLSIAVPKAVPASYQPPQ